MARKRTLEDFNACFNRGIDVLVESGLQLKNKKSLSSSEVKRLYGALRRATKDFLYYKGVAPRVLNACYEQYEHKIGKKDSL